MAQKPTPKTRRSASLVQVCPICGARVPLEKPCCDQCGASLRGLPEDTAQIVAVKRREQPTGRRRRAYIEAPAGTDWAAGDADLHEGMLPRASIPALLLGLFTLAAAASMGILILALLPYLTANQAAAPTGIALATDSGPTSSPTPSPTASPSPAGEALFSTPTPMPPLISPITPTATPFRLEPTLSQTPTGVGGPPAMTMLAPPPTNTRIALVPVGFATVTLPPPTVTLTPTQGPCVQKAKAGDTLYGIAARCGHRDAGVVDEILRINSMSSPQELQIGQEITVPWPTAVGGGPSAGAGGPETPIGGVTEDPLDDLPPGVMWYTIRKGETALSIVFDLGITMRILQDLNPEVSFDGCDFGLDGGGPACNVMVFEGQRMRVPAPPPTPTVPPTPSGSETPTPTATATFNAPISQSPSNNMLFEAFEYPTLRWTSTGRLAANEAYLLTVNNTVTGVTYIVTTRDTSFQLPPDWQPRDGRRHTFTWKVSVAVVENNQAVPLPFTTETRMFTWQSR